LKQLGVDAVGARPAPSVMMVILDVVYVLHKVGRSAVAETEERVYNRLAVLRTERGLSRHDLAAAVGVHYQTVGYLERGEYSPSLQLALRLAGFFGLPVEAIFSLAPFSPLSEQVYRGHPTAAAREASA
jgi:putative transcriptional regulator